MNTTKSENGEIRELTSDELAFASGGSPKQAKGGSGQTFLKFDFKLVSVS